MLWQTDKLVSADADEFEGQDVLHSELVRSLADLGLETELVLSPASEAVFAEVDLVLAAFVLHMVAA